MQSRRVSWALAIVGICAVTVSACSAATSSTPTTAAFVSSASSASSASAITPPPSTPGGSLTASPVPATPTALGTAASSAPEVNPAGDIPDNQVFVPWSPADGSFSVKVPEGWARSDNPTSAVFTDKLNVITVETRPAPTAPTESSEKAAVTTPAGSGTGFTLGDVSTVDRSSGRAILVKYTLDAAADPVTGKVINDDIERYTFWRNGTAVTLTLAGPHGADNVDPWRIVTDSFAWHG